MGKKKLRSCAGCGGRHGPPTGKKCSHREAVGAKEVEAAVAAVAAKFELAAMLPESDVGSEGSTESVAEQADYEALLDFTLPGGSQMPVEDIKTEAEPERPKSPAESGANGAWFLRQHLQEMRKERAEFKQRVDFRINHMENVLGKVAGVQQAQLERLVHLANHPVGKPEPEVPPTPASAPAPVKLPTPVQPQVDTAKEVQQVAAQAATTASAVFDWKDLSDLSVPEGDQDWKDYHGFAAWHLENEKKKKNPFDYQAFIRKGEKVTTFEEIMVITFKTLSKLAELKVDSKGLLAHGLVMAEKAAKSLFVAEAFVGYDEEVRKRAAMSGPAVFGSVLQEEILRHFCYENTKRHRAQSNPTNTSTTKGRSDKTCHRFNAAAACQSLASMHTGAARATTGGTVRGTVGVETRRRKENKNLIFLT